MGGFGVVRPGAPVCAGGDDFDNVIVEWLAKEHLQGLDWRAPRFLANLRALAEAAKVRLASICAVEAYPLLACWCPAEVTCLSCPCRTGKVSLCFAYLGFASSLYLPGLVIRKCEGMLEVFSALAAPNSVPGLPKPCRLHMQQMGGTTAPGDASMALSRRRGSCACRGRCGCRMRRAWRCACRARWAARR